MSRCRYVVAVAAMILFWAGLASGARADRRTYALLVGVSEYPALPSDLQLHGGPHNDVLLFRDFLKMRGVADGDITVLTEGGADGSALPTRLAILDNLSRLAEQVHSGDVVVLDFAGHGSQQPSKDDARVEPDGLDEIFLPRDVGHWDGVPGTVQNAITDNEFGAAIGRLRSRGAFVWAIFDTCHSATMTRAMRVLGEQEREVSPAQLGIPATVMEAARHRAKSSGLASQLAAQSANIPGGYVVFYSAQREESAPQRLFPEHAMTRELHGLFTFALLQALATQPDATYRQTLERVLQTYQGWGIELTTPGYEGTALDARVLGVTNQGRVSQWPLRNQSGRLTLAAGELQGVTQDSVLAVVPGATSNDAALIGYLRVVQSGLVEAEVVPTAYGGKPIVEVRPELLTAYARPVDLRVDFTLHVGLPAVSKYCEPPGSRLQRIIDDLRARPELSRRVVWVGAEEYADVRLCKRVNQLLFLDGTASIPADSKRLGPGLDFRHLEDPPTQGSTVPPFGGALLASLERIGRVINLYRVAATVPSTDPSLSVAVEYCRGVIKAGKPGFDPCQPTAVTAAKPTYHDGDGIRVRLTNTSAHPVDVTVLHVDARYAITALFPDPDEPQEHARLPPHSKPVEFKAELTATPAGLEHLLVIAVPVKPESEEMSFVSLAQSGIPDTASRGPSTALTQLLDEAAFGDTLRGSVRTDARLAATISTFSWTVKP